MAFSSDGTYLATASEQGTIIRVHLVSQANKVLKYQMPLTILFTAFNWNFFWDHKNFLDGSLTAFGGEHIQQPYTPCHSVHHLKFQRFWSLLVPLVLSIFFVLKMWFVLGWKPEFIHFLIILLNTINVVAWEFLHWQK